MDQMHVYAYESMGQWQISASYTFGDPLDGVEKVAIYRGEFTGPTASDPDQVTVEILRQVTGDLETLLMEPRAERYSRGLA